MPLKLNIGASRKVTDHNYGSRGASVNLEVELESSLVGDPPRLRKRIRHLFGLVRTSLHEELNRDGSRLTTGGPSPAATNGVSASPEPPYANGTARPAGPRDPGSRPSTAGQRGALYAIARARGVDLTAYLRDRFGVGGPDELSVSDASRAIDGLKLVTVPPAFSTDNACDAADEPEDPCPQRC